MYYVIICAVYIFMNTIILFFAYKRVSLIKLEFYAEERHNKAMTKAKPIKVNVFKQTLLLSSPPPPPSSNSDTVSIIKGTEARLGLQR